MNRKIFFPLIVIVILALGCASSTDMASQTSDDAALPADNSGQPISEVADQPALTLVSDPAPDQPAEPGSNASAGLPLDANSTTATLSYAIVDTAQGSCYGENQSQWCWFIHSYL